MIPSPTPSSISLFAAVPTVSSVYSGLPAAPAMPVSGLLRKIAGTALSTVKLTACCGVAASLGGLSGAAVAAITVSVLAAGSTVCMVEALCASRGYDLPHAIAQHGVCNDWTTLLGGLAGAAPAAMALAGLARSLADENDATAPRLGVDGLACLATMVAVPTMLLIHKSVVATAGAPASAPARLAAMALPAVATGIALALPTAMLYRQASPDAALRFAIGFGANLASATVREALTQASFKAWSGIERSGTGRDYGLSEASGCDRPASTLLPTLLSSLLFAGSTALTLHYLESSLDLGMAPQGQALLSQPVTEIGRRVALKAVILQSSNELLEGIWRGASLALYAGVRGIELRYRNPAAELADVPVAVRDAACDPDVRNRAAVFAAARTLDGALPNVLTQLAASAGAAPYWNGFRIGAVLAQGATMARTPTLSALVLPHLAQGECPVDAVAAPETADEDASSSAETPSSTATPSSAPDLAYV